jgi:hypothetical protein
MNAGVDHGGQPVSYMRARLVRESWPRMGQIPARLWVTGLLFVVASMVEDLCTPRLSPRVHQCA